MDFKEIKKLIDFVSKSGVVEVDLEMKGVKLKIKTQNEEKTPSGVFSQPYPTALPITLPQQAVAPESAAPSAPQESTPSNFLTIKSPIIGTFYRKSSPDKPNLVEVGQQIKENDVLCVVEAMKLFNEIESEVSGKIVEILVDDSSPVEFDQPLFVIDPS